MARYPILIKETLIKRCERRKMLMGMIEDILQWIVIMAIIFLFLIIIISIPLLIYDYLVTGRYIDLIIIGGFILFFSIIYYYD